MKKQGLRPAARKTGRQAEGPVYDCGGKNLLSSSDRQGERPEHAGIRFGSKNLQCGNGALCQTGGFPLRFLQAEQRHIRRFVVFLVAVHRFPELLLCACHIQNIVHDLERQPKGRGVFIRTAALILRAASQDAAHGGRSADQGAGFASIHLLQHLQGHSSSLAHEIDLLAAHHAVDACRPCQLPGSSQRAFGRNRTGGRAASRLKSEREQRISGQECCGLTIYFMAGSSSTAHIIVIHTRKIVVDQGIRVDHLQRACPRQGIFRIAAAETAELHDEKRPDAFSTAE